MDLLPLSMLEIDFDIIVKLEKHEVSNLAEL